MSPTPVVRRWVARLAGGVVLSACCLLPAARASEEIIDSPMYKSPDIFAPRHPPKTVPRLKPSWLGLWLKALARPEAELRYKAAEAVTLAHQRGIKGLEEAVAPLIAALDRPEQHPAARLAVARALITLEARQAAPSLWKQAQAGSDALRALIEPALARWDYRPARTVWLQRLRDPATPRRSLLLAVEGLEVVREEGAAGPLRKLTRSAEVPAPVRVAAARALGSLRERDLEQDAEQLAADDSARGLGARLAAAALLRRHGGEQAVRILLRLLGDREPAVVASALRRLLEIDAKLVVPALADLLANRDPSVRSLAVEALFRQPSEAHIRRLADRLDDLHPDVRVKARRALGELAAKEEWRGPVIAEGVRALKTQSWRGLEQASILLTRLDHKPAAGRMVELLWHARPEVGLAAAWGLRKLAVPATLPGVVKYIESARGRLAGIAAGNPLLDHQLSQLNQFLGNARYGPADAALRKYIPRMVKGSGPAEARAAAIWALGLIHEGKADPDLVDAVEGRLNDVAPPPPEDFRVRWMSAVTLGRMKAKSALPSLRKHYLAYPENKDYVCAWAIEQITGERLPPPDPLPPEPFQPGGDWFLIPND
jgi:HEAT repeat protein